MKRAGRASGHPGDDWRSGVVTVGKALPHGVRAQAARRRRSRSCDGCTRYGSPGHLQPPRPVRQVPGPTVAPADRRAPRTRAACPRSLPSAAAPRPSPARSPGSSTRRRSSGRVPPGEVDEHTFAALLLLPWTGVAVRVVSVPVAASEVQALLWRDTRIGPRLWRSCEGVRDWGGLGPGSIGQ